MANTAWAFAQADHSDALLFAALARASAPQLGKFTTQGLASVAWAFAAQSDEELNAALARVAERCVGDFTGRGFEMTFWALTRCESLTDAWSLFDHANTEGCLTYWKEL
eukprot:gnl/TRDRNA2_/TRDRNA2_74955_c0_seq2.p2 gnl/TRDRNA2_/TRDRNA2_74955_c0~~gnl/TRDRNA2_/TRDRNA2_74955_c0_seq2.p2  ORF type:complete len:109 (+),score=17.76 gnl/TRDRNA2_/TRDRNA2_74955_c0_seq2:110-436(+)